MRAFVAIIPPPKMTRLALQAASETMRNLGDGVRWTRPENVHLTLKFLGEVPDDALEGIGDTLGRACSTHAPFDARLRGLGTFPSPRRARIIWCGVDEGFGKISMLAASMESALEPWGFGREERNYIPHATLGRARGRSFSLDLPEEGVLETPSFKVSSAHLMKSSLTPGGPVYETVETFTLRGIGR